MTNHVPSLLKWSLLANAIFSATSGVLFLAGRESIAEALGFMTASDVGVTGAQLLAFALFVGFLATRSEPKVRAIQAVIAMDLVWVVASLAILLVGPEAATLTAKWAIAGVAEMVFLFAVLQSLGLRRARRSMAPAH